MDAKKSHNPVPSNATDDERRTVIPSKLLRNDRTIGSGAIAAALLFVRSR